MANKHLENNCRVCWIEDDNDEMLSVFHEVEGYDETLAKMIETCGGIQITELDEHSKIICQNCTWELLVAVKFKRKCIKSIEFLESIQAQLNDTASVSGVDPNDGNLMIAEATHDMLVELERNCSPNAVNSIKVSDDDGLQDVDLGSKLYDIIEMDNVKLENNSLDDDCISYELGNGITENSVGDLFNPHIDDGTTETTIMHIPDETAQSHENYEDVEYLEVDGNEVEYILFNQISKESNESNSTDNLIETATEQCKPNVVISNNVNASNLPTSEKRRKRKLTIKLTSTGKASANINHSCEVCGAGFTHLINLKRHLVAVHNLDANALHTCPLCSIIYSSYEEYSLHLQSHTTVTTNNQIKIEDASETGASGGGGGSGGAEEIEALFDEDFHNSLRKPFKCETCKKSFTTNSALKSHIRTHTGEKPFSCTVCSKTFTTLGGLDLHQRRHSGLKPFKCEFCNRRFVETSNLKVHMRTHTGEKPHVCIICGKGFSRVFLLQLHLRTHTGEKPYSCPVCSKSFAQLCDMSAHKKIHTGERPHRCTVCGKGFIKSSGLHSHMKRHNKIDTNKLKEITNSLEQLEEVSDDGNNDEAEIDKTKYIISVISQDSMIEEEEIFN